MNGENELRQVIEVETIGPLFFQDENNVSHACVPMISLGVHAQYLIETKAVLFSACPTLI